MNRREPLGLLTPEALALLALKCAPLLEGVLLLLLALLLPAHWGVELWRAGGIV